VLGASVMLTGHRRPWASGGLGHPAALGIRRPWASGGLGHPAASGIRRPWGIGSPAPGRPACRPR